MKLILKSTLAHLWNNGGKSVARLPGDLVQTIKHYSKPGGKMVLHWMGGGVHHKEKCILLQ